MAMAALVSNVATMATTTNAVSISSYFSVDPDRAGALRHDLDAPRVLIVQTGSYNPSSRFRPRLDLSHSGCGLWVTAHIGLCGRDVAKPGLETDFS